MILRKPVAHLLVEPADSSEGCELQVLMLVQSQAPHFALKLWLKLNTSLGSSREA